MKAGHGKEKENRNTQSQLPPWKANHCATQWPVSMHWAVRRAPTCARSHPEMGRGCPSCSHFLLCSHSNGADETKRYFYTTCSLSKPLRKRQFPPSCFLFSDCIWVRVSVPLGEANAGGRQDLSLFQNVHMNPTQSTGQYGLTLI